MIEHPWTPWKSSLLRQHEVNIVVPIVLLGLRRVAPTKSPGSPSMCLEMISKPQQLWDP